MLTNSLEKRHRMGLSTTISAGAMLGLAVLEVAAEESLRNRLMLALAYDAALRRAELCLLGTDDLDPAHRTLRVRSETTKTRRGRVVPYSAVAGQLLAGYLTHRRSITRERRFNRARRSVRSF